MKIDFTLEFSRTRLLCSVGLFLFMLWVYTAAGLWVYVYPSVTARLLTAFTAVMLIFLSFNIDTHRQCRELGAADLLMLFSFGVMLINNQNFAHRNYSVELAYLSAVLACIFLSRMGDWFDIVGKIVLFAGFIFGTATVACYISRPLYVNVILPLFVQDGVYSDLLMSYESGYVAGLTNHLSSNGTYLAVACGAAACKTFVDSGKRAGISVKLLLPILVFSLLLTGKRAHIIFTFAALMLVYFLYTSDRPDSSAGRSLRNVIVITIVTVVVFAVLSVFLPPIGNFVQKFIETTAEGDVTQGRLEQISLALRMFAEKPLFGIGWDGFKYLYLEKTDVFLNVHNVYIQVLCESGIIGAAVFYLLFGVEFSHCVRALKYSGTNSCEGVENKRVHLASACFMQTFFLLYCLTGNPLYDAQVLFPYMLSCAVGEYYYHEMRSAERIYEDRYHNISQRS